MRTSNDNGFPIKSVEFERGRLRGLEEAARVSETFKVRGDVNGVISKVVDAIRGLMLVKNTPDDYAVITRNEYRALLRDSEFLGLLHENGVDNWEGYSDAVAQDERVG